MFIQATGTVVYSTVQYCVIFYCIDLDTMNQILGFRTECVEKGEMVVTTNVNWM